VLLMGQCDAGPCSTTERTPLIEAAQPALNFRSLEHSPNLSLDTTGVVVWLPSCQTNAASLYGNLSPLRQSESNLLFLTSPLSWGTARHLAWLRCEAPTLGPF